MAEPTESETIVEQQKTIEKLKRKVKRLEKRLTDKKKYERELLIHTGATPQYIAEINRKDQEAMGA